MRRAFTLQLYSKPVFGDLQGMYPTLQFPCPAPHCNELRTFVISTRHETSEHAPGVMTSYEARCGVCETTATFVGHAENPPELPSYVICTSADIQVGDVLVADHQGNKTPIGYALKAAKAGEIVEVQLGAIDDKDKR